MQCSYVLMFLLFHKALSPEDVILQITDHVFEVKVLLGNWCYNMNIGQLILRIKS